MNIPWWIFALATFAIVWVLTHFGIQLSMRTTAIFGALEMLIMLALAITFLVHPGPRLQLRRAAAAEPRAARTSAGILAGMVFSVLALSGFEAPAPLAQETARPGKFIGRAVMLSLFLIGVFYIFTSYASAIGWGTGNMAAFATNANPYYALGHALWGAGWWFIVIAIINSAIGVGLACTNAASRVMYTMGAGGHAAGPVRPRSTRCTGPRRSRSPSSRSSGIVAILLVGLLLQPADIFGFLGTDHHAGGHRPVCHGEPGADRLHPPRAPGDFNVWRHGVLPWVGTLALLPVLFVTVYPVPAWPYNITPYLFIAALIVGFGYMLWRESRNPGALRRGATMLVGSAAATPQGDVDWDAPAPRRAAAPQPALTARPGSSWPRSGCPTSGCRSAEPSVPHSDLPGAPGRGGRRGGRRPGWTRCSSTPTGSTSRTCPT